MDNISINTSPCDTFSYLYFCLAILLFACGSAITLLSIEGSDLFNTTLSRFWFVGPFFLCSGLMVAFKTLIYIRRKTLITLLAPQNMLSSVIFFESNIFFNQFLIKIFFLFHFLLDK